jgi:Cdc6-like AAA superfamily ATPase
MRLPGVSWYGRPYPTLSDGRLARTIGVMPRLKRGEPEQVERLQALAEAFRPAAPIDRRALFAGRTKQLGDLFGVTEQAGQHSLVYGERGVGKTSLVGVAAEVLAAADVMTARTTCDRSDSFESVWRKAVGELHFIVTRPGIGFAGEARDVRVTASSLLAQNATPHDVKRALQALAGGRRVTIFIDEFDRLPSDHDRLLFADTIKTLSDELPNSTVVLVGVADNVEQLIAEHQSIERALVQIHMPRMSHAELAEIVTGGIERARLSIARDAVETIVRVSQGLPHYAHLLGQISSRIALDDLRTSVRIKDVNEAVAEAIEKTQQTVRETYRRATEENGDPLYSRVVLACALAQPDEFGFFAPADLGEPLDIPGGQDECAKYLDALTDPAYGSLLQRRGAANPRYRFVNPLLQPYVLMRALSEGAVAPELLQAR